LKRIETIIGQLNISVPTLSMILDEIKETSSNPHPHDTVLLHLYSIEDHSVVLFIVTNEEVCLVVSLVVVVVVVDVV